MQLRELDLSHNELREKGGVVVGNAIGKFQLSTSTLFQFLKYLSV